MNVAVNERAVIGGNFPPMTTFEAVKINITDLYEEARQWLDGTPITTQEQADAVNTLKDSIKKAAKAADEAYAVEVKPHQDTVKEIQARYNELTGNNKSVTGLAIKAEQACNAALKPYLIEIDRQQQEAARIAREEADRLQREAIEAMRNRDATNLEEREAAERLVTQAKAAETVASKAETVKAHAKGEGRATGLRTIPRAILDDKNLAAKWVWLDHQDALMAFIQDLADKALRGGNRNIPGFNIVDEKVI